MQLSVRIEAVCPGQNGPQVMFLLVVIAGVRQIRDASIILEPLGKHAMEVHHGLPLVLRSVCRRTLGSEFHEAAVPEFELLINNMR